MRTLLTYFLICISLFATVITPAAAEQHTDGVEIKILGPAFAKHKSLDGSPIHTPANGVMDCSYTWGYSCYGRTVPSTRAWSESNPAFGVELSRRNYDSRDLIFGTVVRDSYGNMSAMMGAGRAWAVTKVGTFEVEAGATAGLWYRTVDDGYVSNGKMKVCYGQDVAQSPIAHLANTCFEGSKDSYSTKYKRALVPFVLPFLSVTELTSGIGVNLALAPKVKIGKYESVPTTTLMLQLTYKLDF